MRGTPSSVLSIAATIITAVFVAVGISVLNNHWLDTPEEALKKVALFFAITLLIPVGIYLTIKSSNARLHELGLIVVGSVFIILMGSLLFWMWQFVKFPADILIWSESDFVNDILKFRQGYPIFTAQANNESFTYVPGTQLVTYFIAWLFRESDSIPAYRIIQLTYTVIAAVFAVLCCKRLIYVATSGEHSALRSWVWASVWFSGLFLIACNNITNPFVHLLHDDALTQLTVVFAYWLLIEYQITGNARLLWIMALIPGVGFWIKQSLIIWALIYSAYLWAYSGSLSFKTKALFTLGSLATVATSIGIGWGLWHEDFVYWTFTVLGSHGVSPLRSFNHLLDIWAYLVAGLVAGAVLLPKHPRRLTGLWLTWLFIILTETYTSGVAWMLNHIGPGTLIAGIWFFALLTNFSDKLPKVQIRTASGLDWLRTGVGVAVVCLIFNGFGVLRIPTEPLDRDAYRYVGEIEHEFADEDPSSVLLDMGTWVYFPSGIVMKDRAPSIGERGYSQTGDFSGILGRLRSKHYAKILVRNLNSPDFWYDHSTWAKSSGIRQAVLENYQVERTISAVAGYSQGETPYGFGEVSVLVPRAR